MCVCVLMPSVWRMANITPIYKKRYRATPSNYHHVCITSICSKLIKHIICSQVMEHYDNYNILTDAQRGFRRGRSCESQLILSTEDLVKSLDNHEQVDAVILDFSKAFDGVPLQRLLLKLHHYGIRGPLLLCIQNFLTS